MIWTEQDDTLLIFYGHCLNQAFGGAPKGYEHVAQYDLHCPADEAIARVALLRQERPGWVKALEWEADQEPEERPQRRRKKGLH
ncbi:MAG TPA: hypothetical protein VL614_15120 [Acetobacteraceae bacterium]|jgi:hypothetical protein|nr:hypothetical protein [Acetobacteraceae bacterium]